MTSLGPALLILFYPEMTSNDVFDVISVKLCLPARRAEDNKSLVPQICEPSNKEWGGVGACVQVVNTMSAMFLQRNVKQPKWILKIYCWIRTFRDICTARKNWQK